MMKMHKMFAGIAAAGLMTASAHAAEVYYEISDQSGNVVQTDRLELTTTAQLKQFVNAQSSFDFAAEETNGGFIGEHLDRGCMALYLIMKKGRPGIPIDRDRGGLELIDRDTSHKLTFGGLDGARYHVCEWGPNDNAALTPAGGYTDHESCNTFRVNDNDDGGAKHRQGTCN